MATAIGITACFCYCTLLHCNYATNVHRKACECAFVLIVSVCISTSKLSAFAGIGGALQSLRPLHKGSDSVYSSCWRQAVRDLTSICRQPQYRRRSCARGRLRTSHTARGSQHGRLHVDKPANPFAAYCQHLATVSIPAHVQFSAASKPSRSAASNTRRRRPPCCDPGAILPSAVAWRPLQVRPHAFLAGSNRVRCGSDSTHASLIESVRRCVQGVCA